MINPTENPFDVFNYYLTLLKTGHLKTDIKLFVLLNPEIERRMFGNRKSDELVYDETYQSINGKNIKVVFYNVSFDEGVTPNGFSKEDIENQISYMVSENIFFGFFDCSGENFSKEFMNCVNSNIMRSEEETDMSFHHSTYAGNTNKTPPMLRDNISVKTVGDAIALSYCKPTTSAIGAEVYVYAPR